MQSKISDNEYPPSLISPWTFLLILFGLASGMLVAMLVLPTWAPNIAASLIGPDPKAYWYLSRASGFIALGLLWLSMVMGLLMTTKIARSWPGSLGAFALHEFISLLGIGFSLFHAIILLGDNFTNFSVADLFIPFTGSYLPQWVGLGQIGFYGIIVISMSYYLKDRIGKRSWRAVHYLSFLIYAVSVLHGITTGSDSALMGAQIFYWGTAAILLFLVMLRVVTAVSRKLSTPENADSKQVI